MATEELDVVEIGRWKTGYSRQQDRVVLVFEFADRKPIGFAMKPETAGELGRALAKLERGGQAPAVAS